MTGIHWLFDSYHQHVQWLNRLERNRLCDSDDFCEGIGGHRHLFRTLHPMVAYKETPQQAEKSKRQSTTVTTSTSPSTRQSRSSNPPRHATCHCHVSRFSYDFKRRDWLPDCIAVTKLRYTDVGGNGWNWDTVVRRRNLPCHCMGCCHLHNCWSYWCWNSGSSITATTTRRTFQELDVRRQKVISHRLKTSKQINAIEIISVSSSSYEYRHLPSGYHHLPSGYCHHHLPFADHKYPVTFQKSVKNSNSNVGRHLLCLPDAPPICLADTPRHRYACSRHHQICLSFLA